MYINSLILKVLELCDDCPIWWNNVPVWPQSARPHQCTAVLVWLYTTSDWLLYKQRPLRAAVLIMQKLEFSICLYIAFRIIFTTLPLLLLVFHFNFRLVKNTLLVMIKSVVTVQKLTGSGLRLKLSQPILTNRSLKNFSTTRYGLKNDADGPDNKLREGVPFESFVKNSENLDHFTHSSRFMTWNKDFFLFDLFS